MNFIKKSILSFVFLAVISFSATSANAACKTHLGDLTGIVQTFTLPLLISLLKMGMAAMLNQQEEALLP